MPNLLRLSRRALFLVSCFALSDWLMGCGHALPEIADFDAATWRSDPYACQNRRLALYPPLLAAREQLYEARADDVNALLGQPDEEELRANTEKVYFYYLRPGSQCAAGHARSTAPRISLRFGPLGTVTEVLLPTGE